MFEALASRKPNTKIPSYDKSAFNGAGDRRPESEWETVNAEGDPPVEVVVFEGWCVGFRALSDPEVERKWEAARDDYVTKGDAYKGQLGKLPLRSVLFVNHKLRDYNSLTDRFNAFMQM